LHAGTPLGAIAVVHRELGEFSDSYVALLQTFADQALLAIENVPAELFHVRAAENISEELLETYRRKPLRKGDGAVGGTAIAREPVQTVSVRPY
jgi:hypothetical protein